MPSVIDIIVGLNHEAVDIGVEHIREEVKVMKEGFATSIGEFASAGFIAELGEKTLEYGAMVKRLSEQFKISTDRVQQLSNVTKLNDVVGGVETAATAYNKLIINQQKAIDGSTEHQKAFEKMGITLVELTKMTPDELFDRVADATKNATDRGEAYDNIVTVMGKSAGSLMATLEKGSEAIKAQGNAMGILNSDTIDSLELANRHLKMFEQQVTVVFGTALNWASRVVSSVAFVFTAIAGESAIVWDKMTGKAERAAEIQKNLAKVAHDTAEFINTGKDPNAEHDDGPLVDPDRQATTTAEENAQKKAAETAIRLKEQIANMDKEASDTVQQGLLDQLGLYERIAALKAHIAYYSEQANATTEDDGAKLNYLKEQEKAQRQLDSLEGEANRKRMEDGKKSGDDAVKAFERLHTQELDAAKELSEKSTEYSQRLAEREKSADDARFESRFRALRTESQQKEALQTRLKQLEAEQAKIPLVMAQAVFDKADEISAIKGRIADIDTKRPEGFKADSLARIGGGGNVAANGISSQQLKELQEHTKLLRKIADGGGSGGSGNGGNLAP